MASLPILYPGKVLDTTQEGCPPDEQLETTRAEIGQDVRSILQRLFGKHCNTMNIQSPGRDDKPTTAIWKIWGKFV